MLVKLAALAIPASLWLMAESHTPRPLTAPTDWTGRYAFDLHEVPAPEGIPRGTRTVHPDFAHIAGWISSVGAAVALFDHDGDGLNNDLCLVDPRFDSVTVAPVPTTGRRYPPLEIGWSAEGAAPGSAAPMGCLPADLDGDGRDDLVLYYWGRAPSLHLAAEGYEARPLLNRHEVWHTNAGLLADVNGDGMSDLVFGNYFPGDFEVLGQAGTARMQRSMSRARNAGQNRLLLAIGPATFADRSAALAEAAPRGWTLSLGAADLDGDMLPEIYVGNDFGPDHLLHNRSDGDRIAFARVTGRRGLTDPRSRVLGRDSYKGMGMDFGDIDRDGVLDMYISNISEPYALMESHLLFRGTGDSAAFGRGRAPFDEISGRTGVARSSWGWDARFADFDGDGWPEILQATGFLRGETDRWPELHEAAMGNDELLQFPGAWPRFAAGDGLSGDRGDGFFARAPDGRWVEAAAAIGLGAASVSRGVALGDVDGDGDVDAVIARQWEPSVVLINRSDGAARSATLAPFVISETGRRSPARGAHVIFHDGRPGEPRIAAVVPAGTGHSGKSAPEVHVGLGAFDDPGRVIAEFTWRDRLGRHRMQVPVSPGRSEVDLVPRLSARDAAPSHRRASP